MAVISCGEANDAFVTKKLRLVLEQFERLNLRKFSGNRLICDV